MFNAPSPAAGAPVELSVPPPMSATALANATPGSALDGCARTRCQGIATHRRKLVRQTLHLPSIPLVVPPMLPAYTRSAVWRRSAVCDLHFHPVLSMVTMHIFTYIHKYIYISVCKCTRHIHIFCTYKFMYKLCFIVRSY